MSKQIFAAGVQYDGTAFHGWQLQRHAASGQGYLEAALSRVADQPIRLHCAGRTDTGVHAMGQVVHWETDVQRPLHGWLMGGNRHSPDCVAIRWVHPVADDFHARFRAKWRRYRYVIDNGPTRPAVWGQRASWFRQPLDAQLMHVAAQELLGEHDFSSFRAGHCQSKNPVKNLTNIAVQRQRRFVIIDVQANAFLHHMVRNLVGTLIAVGLGEQPPAWVGEVLRAKDRRVAGVKTEPYGLYLMQVGYPERYNLPQDPVDDAMPWS